MSHHITIISGRLSKDPVLRYLQNGTAICELTIPINEKWKDKSGEYQEKVTWYDVKVWRTRGEWCNTYLRKGSVVTVTGNVEARGYKKKDGTVQASLSLTARDITPLSDWGKNEGQNQGPSQQRNRQEAAPADGDSIPF